MIDHVRILADKPSFMPKTALKNHTLVNFLTFLVDLEQTRTAVHAKISVFVICVEAIMYLLLHNLHDSTFKV